MKSKLSPLVIAPVFFMAAAAAAQQSASSGLVGLVTDSSQAAIPGATVTVTNVGTNAQRTAVTDGEGRFLVPALPPATRALFSLIACWLANAAVRTSGK